ncbi:MAG: acetyltransferase [Propionibacteriaceae bacterium]|nr:acetyltransferase [Propionibacteriaceae bacterium]
MTLRVVVIGASGFGREALDVLEAMRSAGAELTVVGVVDDGPSELNLARLADRDVAYLGSLDSWLSYGDYDCRYVLGIGSPLVRRQLVQRLDAAGLKSFTAVHPSATFGERAEVADGVVVCAGATVSTNVRLSRHVHINPNVTLGHDAVLEDFVSVNPGAVISGEVVIGSDTLVGASATILQNLRVGKRTVVGAGAVVTKDVPNEVVVTGVPGSWATGYRNGGVG